MIYKAASDDDPIDQADIIEGCTILSLKEVDLDLLQPPQMVVDLRQLHTVRLDLLTTLCHRGHRRARLVTTYREHLAKHFAGTFSRIGLPEP